MKTRPNSRLVAALLVAAGAGGLLAAPTWAQGTAAHEHHHASGAAKPLPPGKRWPTDAPLRQGMDKIRGAIEPRIAAINQDELQPAQYKAIADQAQAQVAYIVSNCKLKPDADAALHGILGQIGEATEAMSGKSQLAPRDGAMKLVEALAKYGRTFEHPGWKPMAL